MRNDILPSGTPFFCDLYHLTMAQAWFKSGKHSEPKTSEAFFRKCPFGGSYLLSAGLGEFLQWAVTTPLYNIGEQVYKISDEMKQQHPEIIWSVVAGLRHRLVHDYEGINWSIIVEVIFDEMNDFVESIKKLI